MLFATALIAFILIVVAWMMHTQHLHTIKMIEKHTEWDAQKREYLLSQVKRRKKVTSTIVMIAVAFLVSNAIPHNVFFVLYWACVTLLLLRIVVLAGIDGFATKTYILSLRDQRIASRRALEEEVKRLREEKAQASSSGDE
ncbi:hypothetical protein ACYFX5_06420 [Bremerella sp. T1]|uniref:hypothetical protein n=1 Tax=Bremerella sp. TYQ1 TaxID=3119568 RepID=UPI001CCF60C0|nr:hypothetical protein [Bremerella volcania]UBM37892.1 hypothetical protein LA756_08365 [Bremerella volcania]